MESEVDLQISEYDRAGSLQAEYFASSSSTFKNAEYSSRIDILVGSLLLFE